MPWKVKPYHDPLLADAAGAGVMTARWTCEKCSYGNLSHSNIVACARCGGLRPSDAELAARPREIMMAVARVHQRWPSNF